MQPPQVQNGLLCCVILCLGVACDSATPPKPDEVLDLSKPADARRFHVALVRKAVPLLKGEEAMRVRDPERFVESCLDNECFWPLEDRISKFVRPGREPLDFRMQAQAPKGNKKAELVGGIVGREAAFDCSWFEDTKRSEKRFGPWLYTTCDFQSGPFAGIVVMRLDSGYVWVGNRRAVAKQQQKADRYLKEGSHTESVVHMKDGKMVNEMTQGPSHVQRPEPNDDGRK